jgi:hypothetical protein
VAEGKAGYREGREETIMATVTIEEAQAHLPDLIDHLYAGEEMVITRNAQRRLLGLLFLSSELIERRPACWLE